MVIDRRLEALTWAVALGLLSASCGSSSSGTSAAATGGSSATGSGGSGATAGAAGALTACPTDSLKILFDPMYSAYDAVHTFQIPVVVNGIVPGSVDINWSASDPSMVKLDSDPTTGEVMVTTRKAGKVTIIASAGSLCGSSVLTITDATSADWQAGSDRYNDGVTLTRVPGMGRGGGVGGGSGSGGAGGAAPTAADAACTNCHGDNATNLTYKTVQHTPRQTGGFSDDDLIGIFEKGVVPKDGYFDTDIVPYATWQTFHKWNAGDAEKGLVVYLRSLTPAAQTGVADFGGRFMGGGGAGGGRNMGGGGRPGAGGAGGRGGRAQGGTAGLTSAGGSGAVSVGGAGASAGGSGGMSAGGSGDAATGGSGGAATGGSSGASSGGAESGAGGASAAGTSGGGTGGV